MRKKIIANNTEKLILAEAPKILIVEDDASNRKIYTMLLKAKGYNVVGNFESAEEAFDFLGNRSAEKPDFIITDFDLPGMMQGVDFIDKVKTSLGLENIKCLMISGVPRDIDLLKAKVDGFLGKPFCISDLLVTIFDIYPHNLPKNARKTDELLARREQKHFQTIKMVKDIEQEISKEPLSSIFENQFKRIEEEVQHVINNTMGMFGIIEIFDLSSWTVPETAEQNALTIFAEVLKMRKNVEKLRKTVKDDTRMHEQLPLVDKSSLVKEIELLLKELNQILQRITKAISNSNYDNLRDFLDTKRIILFSLAKNNFTFFN